jgi:hypothetical protein
MSIRSRPSNKTWGSDDLVNAISLEDCQSLYKIEVRKFTKVVTNEKGCRLSSRSISVGGYPQVQIPKEIVQNLDPDVFGDVSNWNKSKRRFGVGVHLLAYKATTGNQIPIYVNGEELGHKCSMGRMNFEGDDDKGCISPGHLGPISHQENMDQQRCLVFVDLSVNDGCWYKVCSHNFCIGTLNQEDYWDNLDSIDFTVNHIDGVVSNFNFQK